MKIPSYAPYHQWDLHGMWELTILHGMRLRGHEVQLIMCDGLYSDCDIHYAVTRPRDCISCTQCQHQTTRVAATLNMPFTWLGRYLTPDEMAEAPRWADNLDPEEYLTPYTGDARAHDVAVDNSTGRITVIGEFNSDFKLDEGTTLSASSNGTSVLVAHFDP